MAPVNLSYKTDADIVKEEAKGRRSRDDATLLANVAAIEIGTVLERNVAGKYIPLATAANASAIILESAPISATDTTVVILTHDAQVALQALVWPAGFSDANKAAALAALEAKGVKARTGV